MNGENKNSAIKDIENLLVQLHSGKAKCIFAVAICEDADGDLGDKTICYINKCNHLSFVSMLGVIDLFKHQLINSIDGKL